MSDGKVPASLDVRLTGPLGGEPDRVEFEGSFPVRGLSTRLADCALRGGFEFVEAGDYVPGTVPGHWVSRLTFRYLKHLDSAGEEAYRLQADVVYRWNYRRLATDGQVEGYTRTGQVPWMDCDCPNYRNRGQGRGQLCKHLQVLRLMLTGRLPCRNLMVPVWGDLTVTGEEVPSSGLGAGLDVYGRSADDDGS